MNDVSKSLIVIKYGSASVTDEQGMNTQRLSRHASQIAALRTKHRIIIVSSGSVAVGRALWRQTRVAGDDPDIQTLAMLGSAESVVAWQGALKAEGLLASQLLVTHREIAESFEQNSLIKALQANLSHAVIPIINENDALSESELAKLSYGGDNDGLGSHIAAAMHAKTLLLLTETPGVLMGETLIPSVPFDTRQHARLTSFAVDVPDKDSKKNKGRGGMASKIEAAIKAAALGIDTYIGSADEAIPFILSGRAGTHFLPNPDAVV